MDIEEFEKRVKPSAKRSRLEPFRSQIFELKAKGYADWQVRDWLAENGLEVSRQAVQQFIKKGNQGPLAHTASNKETTAIPAIPATSQPTAPVAATGGKLRSEQVLDTPNKSFSFKKLQQEKDQTK